MVDKGKSREPQVRGARNLMPDGETVAGSKMGYSRKGESDDRKKGIDYARGGLVGTHDGSSAAMARGGSAFSVANKVTKGAK